jgi:hypothetical protein
VVAGEAESNEEELRCTVGVITDLDLRADPNRPLWVDSLGTPTEAVAIQFEDRELLWHAGSQAYYPSITVRQIDSDSYEPERRLVYGFLSLIVTCTTRP